MREKLLKVVAFCLAFTLLAGTMTVSAKEARKGPTNRVPSLQLQYDRTIAEALLCRNAEDGMNEDVEPGAVLQPGSYRVYFALYVPTANLNDVRIQTAIDRSDGKLSVRWKWVAEKAGSSKSAMMASGVLGSYTIADSCRVWTSDIANTTLIGRDPTFVEQNVYAPTNSMGIKACDWLVAGNKVTVWFDLIVK